MVNKVSVNKVSKSVAEEKLVTDDEYAIEALRNAAEFAEGKISRVLENMTSSIKEEPHLAANSAQRWIHLLHTAHQKRSAELGDAYESNPNPPDSLLAAICEAGNRFKEIGIFDEADAPPLPEEKKEAA